MPSLSIERALSGTLRNLEVPLFEGLTAEEIKTVLAKSRKLAVEAKARLCTPEDRAFKLLLLVRGRIKFCRLTAEGEEIVLRLMTPGECFGLSAFLPNPPHYLGTAETTTRAELVEWRHKDILELSELFPQLKTNSLRIALFLLSSIADRHAALFSGSADNRIARVLVDLGRRSGTVSPEGIDVSITNEQLGSLADASRFTVSRTLSKWDKAEVITKSREVICIHSPEELLCN